MLLKTKAVVIRMVRYSDARAVVDLFTAAAGRLSFAVTLRGKGVSAMGKHLFQPMTLLDVECDLRPSAKIHKLRSARVYYPFASIPYDPVKISLIFFISEAAGYILRGEEAAYELFDYIEGSLQWLDLAENDEAHATAIANFHLVFLMRLTRFLGFFPNLEGYEPGSYFDLRAAVYCRHHPQHHDILQPMDAQRLTRIVRMDYPTMHLFRMKREERNALTEMIIRYYRIHVPSFPEMKTLDILRELFV